MKKPSILMLMVLVVLAVVIGVLAVLNQPQSEKDAALSIYRDGGLAKAYTFAMLSFLPTTEVEMTIASGSRDDETALFTVIPLQDVLGKSVLQEARQVVVRASDGFTAAFTAEEILRENGPVLVLLQDGVAIPEGSGPLRVLVPSDTFGTRSVRCVIALEVR